MVKILNKLLNKMKNLKNKAMTMKLVWMAQKKPKTRWMNQKK